MISGMILFEAVISHLAERYGEKEIETWYYELWNEPDIFYWSGTCGRVLQAV